MSEPWTITFDCAHAAALAAFWKEALGYVDAPVPEGWDTWEDWLRHFDVPEEEWDDGASIADPDGRRPRISFLTVPEAKTAKNRLHLDVQVGGGRHLPHEVRWPRIAAKVERLVEAGGTVLREHAQDGLPDHVVMLDPEGNEFCVV
jgi:catechol 2,3-dioxygenase-like lactoylglutathione lyase family enzyme